MSRRQTTGNKLLSALLFGGIIFLAFLTPISGANSSSQLLIGVTSRPFPLLMQFDYSPCRCKAWLNALHKAVELLPARAASALAGLDVDIGKGEVALCSLIFPVEVVTPEISAGLEIKVYLQPAADISEKARRILENPLDLLFRILLIEEMRIKLGEIAKAWPRELIPGKIDYPKLENLTRELNVLWDAMLNWGKSGGDNLASADPESLALKLLLLRNKNSAHRYEGYFSLLEEAKEKFDTLEGSLSSGMQKMLKGYLLYLQGSAQMQLGQIALAERTFAETRKLPQFFSGLPREGIAMLLDDALLMKLKGKSNEMCADLERVCGLGDCQALIEARLRGLCVIRGTDAAGAD